MGRSYLLLTKGKESTYLKNLNLYFLASCNKYKQRSKKPSRAMLSNTPIFCSRCTRIVSPTPQESSASSDDSCGHMTNSEEIKKFSMEMQVNKTSCLG